MFGCPSAVVNLRPEAWPAYQLSAEAQLRAEPKMPLANLPWNGIQFRRGLDAAHDAPPEHAKPIVAVAAASSELNGERMPRDLMCNLR